MSAHEWSAAPDGIFASSTIKHLLSERAGLEEQRSQAFAQMEAAEAAVGPAKAADRAATAARLRSRKPGAATPVVTAAEAKAEAALEDAKRLLAGLKQALEQNQADLVSYLDEHRGEVLGSLEEQLQQARVAGLEALNEFSVQAGSFSQLESAIGMVLSPSTTQGDRLRQWSTVGARTSLVAPNGEKMTLQACVDVLAERLEAGSQNADHARAIREVWTDEVRRQPMRLDLVTKGFARI